MKIRFGSSPSSAAFASRVLSKASPRVTRGRVVRKVPPPIPHLPPVHFFAEANVPAGGEATLRSEALSNRTGKPVEIHEIRLSALISASSTFTFVDAGGFIRIRLSVGGKPITNAFVPIWCLGKTEQELLHVNPTVNPRSLYVWRLSRPWYLDPKTPIDAQFQHSGAVRFSAQAQIGLAGRYVENRKTTSYVPYASAFASKAFAYTSTDGSEYDESSERDLVNITGKNLHVDRIIARIAAARSTAGSAVAYFNDLNHVGIARATSLRILTSSNLPIIRDYSNVRAIFGESRSIDVPFVMPPNDFLRVGVKNEDGPTLGTAFTTYRSQAFVSIVGSREEAI